MRSADGTEFTVNRVHLDYDYFGANRYYQYECDYLLKWVSDHPEVNALFDERGYLTRITATVLERSPTVLRRYKQW